MNAFHKRFLPLTVLLTIYRLFTFSYPVTRPTQF